MAYAAIQSSFGIIRWPFLAAPRPVEAGAQGEPKFAVTFVAGGPNGLRPGDQEFLAAVMKQMDEACIAKWNVGVDGMRQRMQGQNKVFNLALKRNNDPTRSKHAGIGSAPEGFHFEAKSKYTPDFFDAAGNKLAQADPTMFYDGAVCRVWVSAYTYEHPKSGPGVGLNINGVQFAQHGPRLGGVEINAGAVDPNAVPTDMPQAPAPNVQPQGGQAPQYGQGDHNPPAANAGASYYPSTQQPAQQQPAQTTGGGGGFGF
jgi:hypothetical protein